MKKINPNYRPDIDPPSYSLDTHLKLGEENPKDLGADGYEYELDIQMDSSKEFYKEMVKNRESKLEEWEKDYWDLVDQHHGTGQEEVYRKQVLDKEFCEKKSKQT